MGRVGESFSLSRLLGALAARGRVCTDRWPRHPPAIASVSGEARCPNAITWGLHAKPSLPACPALFWVLRSAAASKMRPKVRATQCRAREGAGGGRPMHADGRPLGGHAPPAPAPRRSAAAASGRAGLVARGGGGGSLPAHHIASHAPPPLPPRLLFAVEEEAHAQARGPGGWRRLPAPQQNGVRARPPAGALTLPLPPPPPPRAGSSASGGASVPSSVLGQGAPPAQAQRACSRGRVGFSCTRVALPGGHRECNAPPLLKHVCVFARATRAIGAQAEGGEGERLGRDRGSGAAATPDLARASHRSCAALPSPLDCAASVHGARTGSLALLDWLA